MKKHKRELLCHECMVKFTTHNPNRHRCYACQPKHAGMERKAPAWGKFASTIGLRIAVSPKERERVEQLTRSLNVH